MTTPSISFTTLCVDAGLCESNAEARRLVKQHGLSLNGQEVEDVNKKVVHPDDYLHGRYLVLRRGKTECAVAKIHHLYILDVKQL